MDGVLSYIDKSALILMLLSFPAVLFGAGLFELWSRGHTKMGLLKRAIVMGLLAVGAFAYLVDISDRLGWIHPKEPELATIKTRLRLQFFGDLRVPTELEGSQNIYRWFAEYGPSFSISARDAKTGKEISGPSMQPTWTIFVVFKDPTQYRQAVTTFSNPELLPPTQI